jgi:SAM-dependent methyltransferase
MRRETVNRLRFVLEDVLPPIIRDSPLFRSVARLAWGRHIDALADFRARSAFVSDEEYEALYRNHPRVHEQTDNSEACIQRILGDVVGAEICDIGCGTGYLLRRIRDAHPEIKRLSGIDLVVDEDGAADGLDIRPGKIEALPFPDAHFDTVVCTHVLEHILDYRRAIAELRRIARARIIIVVPREREYRYTFNPHLNFYPYPHSFLRAMHPVPADHLCIDVGRDIYYRETGAPGPTKLSEGV